MKFIDEKGRIFGKISMFDLALVLLIVFAVFAIGIKKEATSRSAGASWRPLTPFPFMKI